MKHFFTVLALVIGIAGSTVPAAAEPMRFEGMCFGNHVEKCFIVARGEITPQTPEAFREFLETPDSDGMPRFEGNQIVLNSPGGSLAAGMELGRMIREHDLFSFVGNPEPDENGSWLSEDNNLYDYPTAGTCESACAYAFLGGKRRHLIGDSKLGFHRFYVGPGAAISINAEEALSQAQQISGQLISYLVEMDVDARVFTNASREGSRSMYWAKGQQARELGLVTDSGYGSFFLEPYGNGVVAAAKRHSPPGPYDLVYQVTAYCREGVPKLLFTADFAPPDSAAFGLSTDSYEATIPATDVTTRGGEEAGYLDVTLDRRSVAAITSAHELQTSFGYGRASGGFFETRLRLSDMDRKMLDAAFRLCP